LKENHSRHYFFIQTSTSPGVDPAKGVAVPGTKEISPATRFICKKILTIPHSDLNHTTASFEFCTLRIPPRSYLH
jgi:hypothetical protein